MYAEDFEGTRVLEKLARINRVDDFFAAVDSDDFHTAKSLMVQAGVDEQMIAVVLRKMANEDE